MNNTGDWLQFKGRTTPSSVELNQLFFNKIPKAHHILDFGCGWGRIAHILSVSGYQIDGFDINPAAVSEANKLLNTNIFQVADARKLPYKNSSFDTCLLQAFLTTISREDRISVIQEAYRVLKDDGYLYLADFIRDMENLNYKKRYLKDFNDTGEMGTFKVTKDGKMGGDVLYLAHHFTPMELENILEPYFDIEIFYKTNFTSYHGNPVKGMIILARKKG
jgi:SAM-dependent methyltransferase